MRKKPWWDEIEAFDDDNDRSYRLVFWHEHGESYLSEIYQPGPNQTVQQSAEEVCRHFGWHLKKPGAPPPPTLPERVWQRVKKDLGIHLTGPPSEINRGHWSHNTDVVRWHAYDTFGNEWVCYEPMGFVIKAHKLTTNTPSLGSGEYVINAEPVRRPRQLHLKA